MIKDIIVSLEHPVSHDPARDFAITIAETFDAHIAGIAFAYAPEFPGYGMLEIPPDIVARMVEASLEAAEAAIKRFDEATRRSMLSFEHRLIKDAGCAVFIDRQLAGPYRRSEGLYMRPPFMLGAPTQGFQSPEAPAARYRDGLKAVTDHVKANFGGKSFHELAPPDQDKVLAGLEDGSLALRNVNAKEIFDLLLQNTQEGFFADPIYGGNRDMVVATSCVQAARSQYLKKARRPN